METEVSICTDDMCSLERNVFLWGYFLFLVFLVFTNQLQLPRHLGELSNAYRIAQNCIPSDPAGDKM